MTGERAMDGLRPYTAVLRIRFQTLLQYRAAAVGGFSTQLFFGLVLVYVFEAFYRSTTQSQPMDVAQVVTYVWLGQAFLGMLPWNLDPDVKAMINNGNVAYELLRPMDLYALWYARCLALRTAPTILRAIPMIGVALLFLGMQPPPSLASGAAWAAATVGALLLGCAITMLLNISMLWTVSGEGVVQVAITMVMVFSGMLLPIPLMPGWAQAALELLPFRGLVDLPFRLYVGHIPPSGVWAVLANQVLWTAALVLMGRITLARGMRRVVVQGG